MTTVELRTAIDAVECVDVDQAQTLADALKLVERRFTEIDNGMSLRGRRDVVSDIGRTSLQNDVGIVNRATPLHIAMPARL